MPNTRVTSMRGLWVVSVHCSCAPNDSIRLKIALQCKIKYISHKICLYYCCLEQNVENEWKIPQNCWWNAFLLLFILSCMRNDVDLKSTKIHVATIHFWKQTTTKNNENLQTNNKMNRFFVRINFFSFLFNFRVEISLLTFYCSTKRERERW